MFGVWDVRANVMGPMGEDTGFRSDNLQDCFDYINFDKNYKIFNTETGEWID